jgi:nucleoside-diphosphate-sugar epimerase
MILHGSGLLAQAFASGISPCQDGCIYAAGVSNSNCTDAREYARERERLDSALKQAGHLDPFVYFGTCSIADPETRDTPYVQHKLAMERQVRAHPRHLILRLPQVAGKTPNPHTLLNFLFARISRSEGFCLWKNATRNIIDIVDVAATTCELIKDTSARNLTLNIANSTSYSMPYIITVMEQVVGKRAIYDIADRGSAYPIDIEPILLSLSKAGVEFGNNYLEQVIRKYYGKSG